MRKFFEYSKTFLGSVIGHVSASAVGGNVQIRDLFVREKFRNMGIESVLLNKVLAYATKQKAKKIIAYCGAEPFSPDGQIPLEQEMAFYQENGFHYVRDIYATPVMEKCLHED